MSNETTADIFGDFDDDFAQEVLETSGSSGGGGYEKLPAGVRGIAQLIKLEEHFYEGETIPILSASAVVIEGRLSDAPKGDNTYEGCFTNKTMYLKQGTFEGTSPRENLKKIVSWLADLGYGDEAKGIVVQAGQAGEDPWAALRDDLFPEILAAQPQFGFNTTVTKYAKKKYEEDLATAEANGEDTSELKPKISEFWGKACGITVNSAATATAPAPVAKATTKELTLEELAVLADDGKATDDQYDMIEDAAKAEGVDTTDGSVTWASIVAEIRAASSPAFKVDDAVKYNHRRRIRQCIVTAVNGETCTLKDLESDAEYTDVEFSKLT